MSSLHRMKLGEAPTSGSKDRGAHAGPSLPLVVELVGRSASGGSEASVGSASSLGGRPHTIQRSPLGRSVVTALEAEMDQVRAAHLTCAFGAQFTSVCVCTPHAATIGDGEVAVPAQLQELD